MGEPKAKGVRPAAKGSAPRPAESGRGVLLGALFCTAILMTLSTALKPLVVDDAALYPYAARMAEEPLDPYGFEIFWYHQPEPAHQVLTPPVLPYWWSLAIRLFGDHPLAWKLWLFPVHLLLATSVLAVARRFAPGHEVSALFLVALSPVVLPAINLMLDVPALALGATALVLTLRADERDSRGLTIAAGLVAGLALQTKYNALGALLACLAWLALAGRWRRLLLLGSTASLVFLSWEVFTHFRYGVSHFLYAFLYQEQAKDDVKPPVAWLLGVVTLAGGLLPALGLLALAARGAGRRALGLAALVPAGVFAALPFLPADRLADPGSSIPDLAEPRPELFLFAPLGVLVLLALGLGVGALLGRARGREERFLALWIGIELLVLFALSPFLAGRRLVGLVLPLVLSLGRLASLRAAPVASVQGVAVFGALLGLFFAWTDVVDARARAEGLEKGLRRIEQLGGDLERETVWYVGHWGFQFQAERAGLSAFVPGRSRVSKGEWLLVAVGVDIPRYSLPSSATANLAQLHVSSGWPWSTLPTFFSGPIPMRRQPDAQLEVWVLRFRGNFKAPFPRQGLDQETPEGMAPGATAGEEPDEDP